MQPEAQFSKQNPPSSEMEWLGLTFQSPEQLSKMGLKLWDVAGNTYHWLYPVEWYQAIPESLLVTDLRGHQDWFDRRFMPKGTMPYLPFGFLQFNS